MRNVERDGGDAPARRTRAPQLEALVTLEPLTSIAVVAPEAWIRIGLVHFSVGDYASALRAFESAQPIANETSMKYLAGFNAGRALEGLQRADDAMLAYRRALEIVPDAESATVALTSLQFMRDDRDAAVVGDRAGVWPQARRRRSWPPDGLRQFHALARFKGRDAKGAAVKRGSGLFLLSAILASLTANHS
jgi:tetratricopeptide (TPR) repeat protein